MHHGKKHKNKWNKSNQTLKYILCIFGGVICVIGILSVLIFTGRADMDESCKGMGFSGSDLLGNSCKVDKKYAYKNISVLVGNTANSISPEISPVVKKYIFNSAVNSRNLSIDIISASSGTKMATLPLKFDSDVDYEKYSEGLRKIIEDLEDRMLKEPDTDGVDYFGNILDSAKALSSSSAGEKSLLIVYGSGLSDSGILNFADNNLLSKSAEEVLQEIKGTGIDPMGLNVDIVWSAIGEVATPQEELSDFDKINLTNIYSVVLRNIVQGSGSAFETDYFIPSSKKSIETTRIVKPTAISVDCRIFCKNFDENSTLSFLPNTNIFRYGTDEIARELSELIDKGREHPEATIKIVGYVALESCKDQRDVALAQARADATKDFLVNEAHLSNNIVAVGSEKGVVDECPDGRPNEELRKQNRVVKIEI